MTSFLYFLNRVAVRGLDVLSRAERINALIFDWQIKAGSHTNEIVRKIVKNLVITLLLHHQKNIAETTESCLCNDVKSYGKAQKIWRFHTYQHHTKKRPYLLYK